MGFAGRDGEYDHRLANSGTLRDKNVAKLVPIVKVGGGMEVGSSEPLGFAGHRLANSGTLRDDAGRQAVGLVGAACMSTLAARGCIHDVQVDRFLENH